MNITYEELEKLQELEKRDGFLTFMVGNVPLVVMTQGVYDRMQPNMLDRFKN